MIFGKCCCCIDLRAGAIVIAVLNILAGLGNFKNINEWESIVAGIVGILAGACLLFGAIKYNQIGVIVHLVFSMIAIVMYVILGIIILVLALQHAVYYILAFMAAYFIAAMIQLYFWLCIYSFLQGLKSNEIVSPA